MSFESLLNKTVSLKRKTDKVVDATTILASVTVDRNPYDTAYLVVTIAGCTDGTGDVTITGTDSEGNSQSESLAFTANGIKQTANSFTTVTGLTTLGFIDETVVGTIEVKAVTQMGQPIYSESIVDASIKARIEEIKGRIAYLPQGQVVDATHRAFCSFLSSYIPTEDDILVDGNDRYKINFSNKVYGRTTEHHWELLLEQL
jgi:hypothetical protein